MQSSLEFFCEECGAANPENATHCFACNQPLSHASASLPASPLVRPVVVTPFPILEVCAGATQISAGAEAADDALKPGTLMQKRYSIHSEIGRGGYSIVYKAFDTMRHNRPVSIKQINLRNLTSRQVIEATETFNRETMLLPLLKHEGLPKFYGHFTDPEHWYLVMEYIPGQTLEDYLKSPEVSGCCSLDETLKIGIALSTILEYLHLCRPPLIFRDIKPANIMITPRKKLYLIDFGIARSFHPGKNKDTTPLGSPGYAAPEQYGRGQSDARTDIYGLGATLRTLLTGRDPLELRAGEPSLAARPVPDYVQKLLNEMVSAEPSHRPGSMALVRNRLRAARTRLRRMNSYLFGLGLGAFLIFWSYLGQLIGAISPGAGEVLDPMLSCLWVLTLLPVAITMFCFLFVPSKRYISFGAISAYILLLLILRLITILHGIF